MLAQLSVNDSLRVHYQELIENLSLKEKSELMVALAEDIAESALKTKNKSEEDAVYELAGSWKDDRTVEEMIADIYSSRMSNTRFLEHLDD
jgi:5-deoxy-D-glucuronate isomerase